MENVPVILIPTLGLLMNLIFSNIIFNWEIRSSRRVKLLFILWILPFLGALCVYRKLNLRWFKRKSGSKGSDAAAMGFLEMEVIFNPAVRHQIEARDAQKTEILQYVEKSNSSKSE